MRKSQFAAALLLGGVMSVGLVACEKKGPAEKAGEKIDEAARDVKQGVEKAGDKLEEAGEDVNDKIEGRK